MKYDHYIGIDWSKMNMAIARMTPHSEKIRITESAASVDELQSYLKSLRGQKIVTFEESTPAQWLYLSLREYADQIIVCDPHRNRLLSEGGKNDRIDAEKLVSLLRGNFVKPVYHTADRLIELRRLVSHYEDTLKVGVQTKNRRAALLQANGKSKNAKEVKKNADQFVLNQLDQMIQLYENQRGLYEKEFKKLRQKHQQIGHLESIPGIGIIGAVKILATVIDASRFQDKSHFLSYCGLVKLHKISGGKVYGRKKPRYSRRLKDVFKTGALSIIRSYPEECFLKGYYHYLMEAKNYPEYKARHALARKLATITFGVLKQKKKYDPRSFDHVKSKEMIDQ